MAELSAARLSSVQRIKDRARSSKEPVAPPAPPANDDLSSIRRALTIMAVVTCGGVLWAAQSIIVPTALGVVLALVLTPVVSLLEKWRIPTSVAALLVVLMAAAAIAGTVMALQPGFAAWIERAPQISRSVEQKLQPIKGWLASFEAASDRLEKLTKVGPPPTAVVASADSGASLLETAPAVLAQTFYVVVLALFLIGVRKVYRTRLILLSSDREDRLRVARIMNESLEQVSEYLFTMLCISVGLAVVTAICFAIAGIENPVLWGTVFGAACLIPYIGPTAVILVCGLVQFATQATLAEAAVGPLILLAINTVEANFVTPLLVSRRTAVSAIAIFLTVAAFVWLWGPAASIVAVPLLILFSAVAKHVPSLQPYAVLLQAESNHPEEIKNAARMRFFADDPPNEQATWFGYAKSVLALRNLRLPR